MGADISEAKQAKWNGEDKSKDKDEDVLTFKKGAYCVLTKGVNKDLYGVIEGLDEDNARVMVKLTLSGKIVTQSQYSVKLVSKKEYNKYSKYLNKGKTDEYKEKERQKNESKKRSRSRSRERSHKRSHKHRSRSRSKGRSEKYESRSNEKSHRRDKEDRKKDYKERNGSHREEESRIGESRLQEEADRHYQEARKRKYEEREHVPRLSEIWVRPQIKVRIIDKNYKKGKYHKSKVTVLDVPGPENCICKSEEGNVLEGLAQSQLETVIPKSEGAFVLVVSGKYRGQLGEVISKNKKKSMAAVQLLQDRDNVMNIDFDHICEFVGDIHEQFDY